ncbi:NAD(P)-binding protein [Mesorhizobium sp. AR07]|uniref:NAD(P)-binding protein n=1 Tax=Mesorhizobium sp. AR07 TaxID=2865838 RepID=UPI0029E803AF|nr:NAD(P)-binding protein [Mesorhizobium sp. AR07]
MGAGPVGLAAAAHLVERGIRPIIFERNNLGPLACSFRSYWSACEMPLRVRLKTPAAGHAHNGGMSA